MSQKYRVDTDKGSFIVETEDNPSAPAAPSNGFVHDDRSAGQVALDQTMNVGKGIVGAITGIPGMVKEAGGIMGDAVMGKQMSVLERLKNLVSGAGHSVVDPIATSARGAAAYVAPQSVTAPSQKDWEGAAQDAGGNLGNLLVAEGVKSIPTSAEGIQGVANKLRALKQAQQPGVPTTMAGAVKTGVGVAAGPVASLVEKAAKLRAALDLPPTAAAPTPAGGDYPATTPNTPNMPAVGKDATTGLVGGRVPAEAGGSVRPAVDAGINEYPRQVAENVPPAEQPPVTSAAPEQPGVNPVDQAFLDDVRKQSANQNTPDLEMRQPGASLNQPIEMTQPPVETPTIKGPATSNEIQMAREALLQNGAPRSTANLLKVSRIVPELLNTVPELKSVPPGANFDTRLFNAFDRIGHELNATEASIPDSKMVPTDQAVKQLSAIEQKFIDTNQPNAVRAIDKVKSFLAEKPAMAWDDFIQAKRAFFNEIKLSSAPGREAYQIFKNLSNDVSPELGELNQKYFVLKSAMESAAMDLKNGERIRTIGKPVGKAAPVQPQPTTRNLRGLL